MGASAVLGLSREKLVKRRVVMRRMARGAGAFCSLVVEQADMLDSKCLNTPYGARCFLTWRGLLGSHRTVLGLMPLLVLGAF